MSAPHPHAAPQARLSLVESPKVAALSLDENELRLMRFSLESLDVSGVSGKRLVVALADKIDAAIADLAAS